MIAPPADHTPLLRSYLFEGSTPLPPFRAVIASGKNGCRVATSDVGESILGYTTMLAIPGRSVTVRRFGFCFAEAAAAFSRGDVLAVGDGFGRVVRRRDPELVLQDDSGSDVLRIRLPRRDIFPPTTGFRIRSASASEPSLALESGMIVYTSGSGPATAAVIAATINDEPIFSAFLQPQFVHPERAYEPLPEQVGVCVNLQQLHPAAGIAEESASAPGDRIRILYLPTLEGA